MLTGLWCTAIMSSDDATAVPPDPTRPEPVPDNPMAELGGPTGITVNMLLADAAQVADGKLYVLGGGLTLIGPRPQTVAVAMRIELPWDRANIPHQWRLDLYDEDGRLVAVNDKPVQIQGRVEAGRPAGMRPGNPLAVALAINISQLGVPPGRGYAFQLSIEGQTRPEWRLVFASRPARPTPA